MSLKGLKSYSVFSYDNEIILEMTGKSPNSWKLKNTLLNNPRVQQEFSRNRKYTELNEHKKAAYKNTEAKLRGKFTALNGCIRK